MCHLQILHDKYKNNGLVILGFDFSDDKQIAQDFLRENSATFPSILDTSDDGVKTGFFTYGATSAPVNYILDREGRIVDAWIGYEDGHKRALDAIQKAGLKLQDR